MSVWTIALQSLRYYWRSHLGVLLGVVIGTAVLTGALLAGDSVRSTLLAQNLRRLGSVEFALTHPTRFVRDHLAEELEADLQTTVAPVLHVPGMAGEPGQDHRINRVSVYGVEDRFWRMGEDPPPPSGAREGIRINLRLSEALQVRTGDTLLLRVDKPATLSRDSPLSTFEDPSAVLRLPAIGVVHDEQMGAFDLRVHQVPPYNAFVPLAALQKAVGLEGKANMLLVQRKSNAERTPQDLQKALQKHWTLDDAQLELRTLPHAPMVELRTGRIFLDDVVQRVIRALDFRSALPDVHIRPIGILTYLVNEISANGRGVPYSVVAAIERTDDSPYPALQNLHDNETVVNQWLADDLHVKPGDVLTLSYFVLGRGRELHEQEQSFTIAGVVPMSDPLNDPELMPDYPGIAGRANCRDWDPGFDIQVRNIRDRDEAYWDLYRGAPKAVITLGAGQAVWSNRFGNLTAIRFSADPSSPPAEEWLPLLRRLLESSIQPFMFGFAFQPVREQAVRAAEQSMNFAPLFMGFSFFLIAASLILTALLFLFQVEQRVEQTGILLACGFSPRAVRRLYLAEGLGLACLGGLAGLMAAVLYTGLLLWGLSTIWKDAVSGLTFQLAVRPSSLVSGFLGSVLVTLLALGFGLRRQSQVDIRELLASAGHYQIRMWPSFGRRSGKGLWFFGIGILAGICLLLLVPAEDPTAVSAKFFGAGTLILIACLGLSHFLIQYSAGSVNQTLSLTVFGIRNTARRAGRSLTIVAMLACGSFLVIAVGANRQDPLARAGDRSSGTGGFAFFGESSLPLLHDLNTESGRSQYGLSEEDTRGVSVVPLRLRPGDEASCLNLNRAQIPQLLGIPEDKLAERNAFSFAAAQKGFDIRKGWNLLKEKLPEDVIPGIADQATIQWALGKSLGGRILYTDEHGNPIQVQLVASLSHSILQGSILIAEDHFVRLFPSISGYQQFLVDAPAEQKENRAQTLQYALQDIGWQLTPAAERLAAFTAVENTYLSIFQLLGGLGLILGAAGVAVVVLRNVLERRSELALLQAVGFPPASLRLLVLSEHWLLLLLGLGSGVVSGLLAVLPQLLSRNSEIPYASLLGTLLAMIGIGILWIWLAGFLALRGNLLRALQNE